MHRALVFGEPALAQRLVLSLAELAHAELCHEPAALAGDAGIVVFADAGRRAPAERAAALAAIASAARQGRRTAVLANHAEASRWLDLLARHPQSAERPLRRVNIVGEAGVGKTVLAGKLAPALDLPHVSVDAELWWGERQLRTRGAQHARVRELAGRPEWLAEGPYPTLGLIFATSADLTIHLDLPASIARRQRNARPRAAEWPLHRRLALRAYWNAFPYTGTPRLRRQLSRLAHRAPLLRIRTEAERDAVTAALLADPA